MTSEPTTQSTRVEVVSIPWETRGRVGTRYLGTLVQALRPIRSAPAFAGRSLVPAIRFALASALPVALIAGIIPYTRTLMFGPRGQLSTLGSPSGALIAFDVVRAMGLSVAVCLAYFLALALPYISLSRAYGREQMRQVAPRLMLYRAWLVPFAVWIQHLVFWLIGSEETVERSAWVGQLAMMLPLLLLFLAMRHTAQRICGVRTWLSFVIVIVPFVLLDLVRGLSDRLLLGFPG